MKRSHHLLFLLLAICSINLIHAQTFSAQETKKILTSFEWKLIRSEKNGNSNKLQDGLSGAKLVFTSKYVYSYSTSEKSDIELSPYSISGDKLVVGENVEDPRMNFKLKQGAKYNLYTSNADEDDAITYVWEQAEPISGDGLPKDNYSIAINKNSYSSTPVDANAVIRSINEQLNEAKGNIRIFKPAGKGKRLMIDDVSFIATEMGVQVMVKLSGSDVNPTTWTYEFMPEHISEIKQAEMPEESPIGQVSMTLNTATAFVTTYEKTTGLSEKYTDKVTINFLKVDPGAYKKLEASLKKLKDIYLIQRRERLDLLASFMNDEGKFWISGNNSSMTYELAEAFVTGGTIRFQYYLQNISTSGDSKDWYVTVVPLKDIEEITLDKTKSRPNTILLTAGKKSFTTYKINKDDVYVPTSAVRQLPIFIDVSKNARLDRVVELLKTHVKELGGKKLSL